MAAKRKSKAKGPGERSFEEALAELEDVVAKLESGDVPLDESIELYERGIARFKRCHELLKAAEKRIEMLAGDGPKGLRIEPFDSGDEPEDEAATEDGGHSGDGELF